MKVVATSGYFDPLHVGHLECLKMAAELGDKLIVIVNSDLQAKLKKGEFLYSVQIPINKKNYFKAYKISKRFDDDISSVCASFNFSIKNDIILKANIAYGGMSEIPKRATTIEKALTNSAFSEDTFLKAQKLIAKDFSPIDDMRASRTYRMEIAKNLLSKCFLEIKNNKLIRLNK